VKPGLTAAGILGLLGASIAVRSGLDPAESAPIGPPLSVDPPTGAVLLDLDDDLSADDQAQLERAIRDAIEPYAWRTGEAALGDELSDSANLYRITPPPSEVHDVLRALSEEDAVEAVEIERVWSLPEGAQRGYTASTDNPAPTPPARGGFTPNDPYYKHQWHMDQIQMPIAWAASSRGRGAVVAIIDTGVLYRDSGRFRRAPDLAETRFVAGHDFVDGDEMPDDEHGHGTHVAGTVAQSTNNRLGVAGVAPAAAIMPIRVLNRNGAGSWGSVAAGIRWAADHGANVINLSLGGSIPSRAIAQAVQHAHDQGVTVVAAAGNTGRGRIQFPAAYKGALAVGAVRLDGERAFYSSYGRGLGIMAPGGDLRVDQNGDGMPDGVLQNTMVRGNPSKHDYVAYQGTSMAAPHVAGAAALLYGEGVHDPDSIVRMLQKTAQERGAEADYGAGILQAGDATQLATSGLGIGRLLALGLLLLLNAGALRRRGRLGVSILPAFAVGAVWVGALRLLPLPAWLGHLLGGAPLAFAAAPAWLFPLLASAALPLLAVALFLSTKKLRPVVVGLAFGTAAYLMVEALVPTVRWSFGPALLAGPWLLLQAGVAGWVGRTASLRD
jgi:serine protease